MASEIRTSSATAIRATKTGVRMSNMAGSCYGDEVYDRCVFGGEN